MTLAVLAVLSCRWSSLASPRSRPCCPRRLASLDNAGPHGLSEILYAYSSATGNNGSAFGGLSANTPWYNTTLGIAMVLGRFAYVMPVLAIAGSMVRKTARRRLGGTFPTDTPLFVGLLVGLVLILGGLHFFPVLALGPIVEHVRCSPARRF